MGRNRRVTCYGACYGNRPGNMGIRGVTALVSPLEPPFQILGIVSCNNDSNPPIWLRNSNHVPQRHMASADLSMGLGTGGRLLGVAARRHTFDGRAVSNPRGSSPAVLEVQGMMMCAAS